LPEAFKISFSRLFYRSKTAPASQTGSRPYRHTHSYSYSTYNNEMHTNEDESTYEVCFTVSPDKRTDQIARVGAEHIFYGNLSEDVRFTLKASSEEDAEEKGYNMLTDPLGPYVKKFGPGFEVKQKYVWRIY
jgi:hypothetical protein